MMRNADHKKAINAAVFFLIWPFLATVLAFKNYKSSWAKNIVWAFTAFFGYTFTIGAESQGSDIVRYVLELEQLHQFSMGFNDALRYFFTTGEVDILRTLIVWLVSRVTDQQPILTLVYAIIFGYFYSRNVWFVLTRLEGKIKWATLILLASFMLTIPIWYINGFRMWTAAHIFTFGVFNYFFVNRKKGLWIAFSSCLAHFAFIVPFFSLIAYKVLGNRKKVFFVLLLATSFWVDLDVQRFNKTFESFAPEVVQERTSSYRDVEKIESRKSAASGPQRWYARLYLSFYRWVIIGLLALLYYRGNRFFKANPVYYSYFCFLLFLFSVANLMGAFGSGGRFSTVALLLASALIVLFMQNSLVTRKTKLLYYLMTPGLLLFILVSIRSGLYTFSLVTILGNPFLAIWLTGENLSLNDLIKSLL